jgi:hypothetical protein
VKPDLNAILSFSGNDHSRRFRPINLALKLTLRFSFPLIRLGRIMLIPVLYSLASCVLGCPSLCAPYEPQQVIFLSLQVKHIVAYGFAFHIHTRVLVSVGSGHADLHAISEAHTCVRVDVDIPDFFAMIVWICMVELVDVDATFLRLRIGGRSGDRGYVDARRW